MSKQRKVGYSLSIGALLTIVSLGAKWVGAYTDGRYANKTQTATDIAIVQTQEEHHSEEFKELKEQMRTFDAKLDRLLERSR